jgi:hypothetical protein
MTYYIDIATISVTPAKAGVDLDADLLAQEWPASDSFASKRIRKAGAGRHDPPDQASGRALGLL